PAEDAMHRPEQRVGHRELVPPVVEHEHPAPVGGLLELPAVARCRYLPTTPSGADDLHVDAGGSTDRAVGDERPQHRDRWIEEVVLHDAQLRARGAWCLEGRV